VKTLPQIREGIEERQWPEAQAGIGKVAESIRSYSAKLDEAIGLLK
jgi:N-acetylated-alpha-linked acidic dipeptidase